MIRSYTLHILVALMLLSQLMGASPVSAQTAYRGVVVRLPATAERYLEVSLDPGTKYEGNFIVQHEYQDRKKQVKLYIYASDFIYDNNNETVLYPDDGALAEGSYSLSKWVKFDRTEVTLDHYGQEEKVYFTINVPAGATPGARYANIIISNSPLLSSGDKDKLVKDIKGAAIVTRLVATTLLITVSGDKEQNVYLEDLSLTDSFGNPGLLGTNIFEFHPVVFRVKVRNMGNQALLPGGDVFVHRGTLQDAIFRTELNPYRDRLLPNSQRSLAVEWSDSSFKMDRTGFVTIDLEHFFNFHWGHFYARINMLYRDINGELAVLPGEIDFWVVPWKPIAVLVILLLIVGGYSLIRRRTGVEFISLAQQELRQSSWRARLGRWWRRRIRQLRSKLRPQSKPVKRS